MDSKYSKVCCTPGIPFESMDFLSRNSAIQVISTLGAAHSHDPQKSETTEENILKKYTTQLRVSQQDKDRTVNADENSPSSAPLWQTDNLKSWIWLQHIIHPELKLDRCFRKKWTLAKIFRGRSIRFWLKEIKRNRKEETRLRKAEVHAAISVAGVAAALAAVAAENVRKKSNCGRHQQKWQGKDEEEETNNTRDAVLASAAALVAAQCVEMAQTMGAKTEQLGSAIGSALTAKDVDEIITLTAAAATSLRGAATLRGRTATRTGGAGSADEIAHLLQYNPRSGIDSVAMPQDTIGFDFLKGRSLLARETLLVVITRNGMRKSRLISVLLDNEAKVILRIRKIMKLNPFTVARESTILDLHSWPPEKWTKEDSPPYFIVFETSRGILKLEMNNYSNYKLWSMMINHMLMLSTSYSGYGNF